MRRIFTLCLLLIWNLSQLFSQNIGINLLGTPPNASAILDLESENKGFLIPRVSLVTTTSNLPVTSPATSLAVFNLATVNDVFLGYYYWNGTRWVRMLDGNDAWKLQGNSNTNSMNNYIGTNDNQPLKFRVNNEPSGEIDQNLESTYFGYNSGLNAGADAEWNTGFGAWALSNVTTGFENIAVGDYALFDNTTGYGNVAIGSMALGSSNRFLQVAVGYFALANNTNGIHNVALGAEALLNNTLGSDNTALGSGAMTFNTNGGNNTAVGSFALVSNTVAFGNTAVGGYAAFNNTDGVNNTALGAQSLFRNSSGINNTSIGNHAAFNNTLGNNNVALGYRAGHNFSTGNNNIVIGSNVNVPVPANDNQIRLGNHDISLAEIQVAWTVTSDEHWKNEITPLNYGINLVNHLKPVSYKRRHQKESRYEFGFIAQDLVDSFRELNILESGIISIDDNGLLGVRYNDFIPVLTKAIQDQQTMIKELTNEIQILKENQKELQDMLKQK
ncbi:MAG: tail fiber domain-containing protein [Crocinitomicaceae bacterium]|nr:tail fiber domain-containing protein [Crocinitomicaceae bacterium]